jgi:hypothetical protein
MVLGYVHGETASASHCRSLLTGHFSSMLDLFGLPTGFVGNKLSACVVARAVRFALYHICATFTSKPLCASMPAHIDIERHGFAWMHPA